LTQVGGMLEMMQLWVNLPAKDKLAPPRYQTLLDADIPHVPLADGAGTLRIIAGSHGGMRGPALTFTPIEVWDLRLCGGKSVTLALPDGHTAALVPMQGRVTVNGSHRASPAQLVQLSRAGTEFTVAAEDDLKMLVLGGQPIAEPVVGYGPFVMNTEREIAQAFADFQGGRFGRM
jgi:hypothetical protein